MEDALYIHEALQGALCHGMVEEDARMVKMRKSGKLAKRVIE